MFATHMADIEFTTVLKSDRAFMGCAGKTCAQPPAPSQNPRELREALLEEWQNVPQGPFKVSLRQRHSAVINADEAHDRYQWPKPHFLPTLP
jgi:hypothetical protein